MLTVSHSQAFKDNYIWLIHGRNPAQAAIVDPGDAEPVIRALEAQSLEPGAVLVTHHHWDHTGGVAALRDRYGIPVYGPAREARNVVGVPLAEGDQAVLDGLGLTFGVLDIPAHTAGHIAFHGHGALFCGDTLFSAGCGRLFEGTAEQMYASLRKLAALPPETLVYCGHEYTEANLRFALTVEPDNPAARDYLERCRSRPPGQPTLPSTLALERQVNVFLRTDMPAVRQAAENWSGSRLNDNVATFRALRQWKDNF